VSGTVALMLSAAPNLTNAQVIGILQSTARPFPTVSDTTPQPAVCQAPTSTKQDECICTTTTCGAGMLDAGKAVAAAAALSTGTAPTAVVAPTSASVVAGSTVTLSGSGSALGSSGAALSYQWSIPDADSFITLDGTSGASVVVTGVSAGTGQVQLTVTDPSNGQASSATVSVTVTAAAVTSSAGSGGGGGGGGAAKPAWLLALLAAGLLLGPRGRRSR
jgi:serine protease